MRQAIVKIGNPILRAKTRDLPATAFTGKKLHSFLSKMALTMRACQGVGLAANQVGENLRAFVMECRVNRRYPQAGDFPLQSYLNARIVKVSKAIEKGWEGCLSIPGFRGVVPRARQITLEAYLPNGRKVRRVFKGFEARVVQHEVDHLNGLFYIDRMTDWNSWTHLEEFNKRFKVKVKDKGKS